MFNKRQQYQAYHIARETAPKTKQVVMLYDGATRFLQQARQAIEENRIEDRFNLLHKVSEIFFGLQGCLDYENGGEIAPILSDYYSSLDARILYVQRTNDLKILDAVIAEVKQMRGAWGNIDQLQSVGHPPVPDTAEELAVTFEDRAAGHAHPSAAEQSLPEPVKDNSAVVISV